MKAQMYIHVPALLYKLVTVTLFGLLIIGGIALNILAAVLTGLVFGMF